MQKNALVVLCGILASVQAYSRGDSWQFQQAFPRVQELEEAEQLHYQRHLPPSHRQPHYPLYYHEGPEDLLKLEAHLNSDGQVLEGEIDRVTPVKVHPDIATNYGNQLLRGAYEPYPYQEPLSRIPSLSRSPESTFKFLGLPRLSWPSFNIPLHKLLPHRILNEFITAIIQQVMIEQIKHGLVEPHSKPQNMASLAKRTSIQMGIITTKLLVHQLVRALAFSYLGPLGVIVTEEALFGLGEYITKKVMKRMKKQQETKAFSNSL